MWGADIAALLTTLLPPALPATEAQAELAAEAEAAAASVAADSGRRRPPRGVMAGLRPSDGDATIGDP